MTRKLVFIAVAAFAVFSLAAAQGPDPRMGPRRKAPATVVSAAENQVLQVEHEWTQAYLNHDLAALENILADDYTFGTADGSFKTRGVVLEEFRVDTMKYESIMQYNLKARVYGNTAVVTGEEIVKGSDGGKEISSHTRFTDVFVKREERWQAVASHESTIPEAGDAPAAK